MRNLIKVIKALSDETRLRMVHLLLERECCVCEIEYVLQISQSVASRNLSALYEADIVVKRREGTWTFYSINSGGIPAYREKLIEAITDALKNSPVVLNDRQRFFQLEPMSLCRVKRGSLLSHQ